MGIFKKEVEVGFKYLRASKGERDYGLGKDALTYQVTTGYKVWGFTLFKVVYWIDVLSRSYVPGVYLQQLEKEPTNLIKLAFKKKGAVLYTVEGKIEIVKRRATPLRFYKERSWKLQGNTLYLLKSFVVRSVDPLESFLLRGVKKGLITKAEIEGLLQ